MEVADQKLESCLNSLLDEIQHKTDEISNMSEDQYELEKQIDQLKHENLELKFAAKNRDVN
jgi:ribosomal protein L29